MSIFVSLRHDFFFFFFYSPIYFGIKKEILLNVLAWFLANGCSRDLTMLYEWAWDLFHLSVAYLDVFLSKQKKKKKRPPKIRTVFGCSL